MHTPGFGAGSRKIHAFGQITAMNGGIHARRLLLMVNALKFGRCRGFEKRVENILSSSFTFRSTRRCSLLEKLPAGLPEFETAVSFCISKTGFVLASPKHPVMAVQSIPVFVLDRGHGIAILKISTSWSISLTVCTIVDPTFEALLCLIA
jgi:hypothetical protein